MGAGASFGRTKVFKKTTDIWKNSNERYSDDRLKAHIKEMYSDLVATGNSPFPEKVKKQRIESERLVASGSFAILCRILTGLLQTERQSGTDGGTQGGEDNGELLHHVLWSVAVASENCDQVCKAVLEDRNLITALVSRLESTFQLFERSDEKMMKETNTYKIMLGILCIVHNVSVYVDDVEVEEEEDREDKDTLPEDPFTTDLRRNIIHILKRCAGVDDVTKLKAIAALACLVEDDDEEVFTPDVIHFLLLHFSLAILDQNHQSCYCSAAAILSGLRHLLRANNKQRLGLFIQNGVALLLAKGLRNAKTEKEKEACLYSLWLLTFNQQCLKDMAEDKPLMDLVKQMTKTKRFSSWANQISQRMAGLSRRRPVKEALQQQQEQHQKEEHVDKGNASDDQECSQSSDESKAPPETQRTDTSGSTNVTSGHVMLSYQTDDRAIMLRIRDFLKSKNIDTWMDVDDMTKKKACIVDRMAEAVDDAFAVIIGVSEKYSKSRNCKYEANFAFKQEKEIIPLKLHKNYTPKGWLSFIESTEYYFTFAEEKDFDDSSKGLLRAIQNVMKTSGSGENPGLAKQLGPVEFQKEEAAHPEEEEEEEEEEAKSLEEHPEDEQTADNTTGEQKVGNPGKETSDRAPEGISKEEAKPGLSGYTPAPGGQCSNAGKPAADTKEKGRGPEHTLASSGSGSDGDANVKGEVQGAEGPSVSGYGSSDEKTHAEDQEEKVGEAEDTHASDGNRSDENTHAQDQEVKVGEAEDTHASDGNRSDEKTHAEDQEKKVSEPEDTPVSDGKHSDEKKCTGNTSVHRYRKAEEKAAKEKKPITKRSESVTPTDRTDQSTPETSASQNMSGSNHGNPLEETNSRMNDDHPNTPGRILKSPSSKRKLKARLEAFGLESKYLDALTERDLRFLVRLKAEAPEIYYKSVRNDLHLHTISEMARFSEALSGTGSPLQATPGRSLTVLHFKF